VIAVDESSFERLVNIQSYSDAELKRLAEKLAAEEAEVSKRRRLLQGELDIVRAELVRRLRDKSGSEQGLVMDGDVAALSKILANKGPSAEVADK
jgi:RsiG-like